MDEALEPAEPGPRRPRRGLAVALVGSLTALVALVIWISWPAGAATDDCHRAAVCITMGGVIEPSHGGLLPDEEDLRNARFEGVRYAWHSGDNAPIEFDLSVVRSFAVMPACTGEGEMRISLVGNYWEAASIRFTQKCQGGRITLPVQGTLPRRNGTPSLRPGEDLSMHIWIELTGGGVGVCYFVDDAGPSGPNVYVPSGTGPASPGAKPSPQPWPMDMTPLPPGYRPAPSPTS
jgi:hypothetical protein